MARQNPPGAPGQAEVWKLDDAIFLVWRVPFTDQPIMWRVYDQGDRERIFGVGEEPKIDRRMTYKEALRRHNALNMGSAERIESMEDNPFRRMIEDVRIESQVKPWLMDPEMLAIRARATMERRNPTDAEIQSTRWWRTRSEGERDWYELVNQDPATARQTLSSNRLQVRDLFRSIGWADAPASLVDYWADQWTHGKITEERLEERIMHEADPEYEFASPYAGYYLPDNAQAVQDKDGTQYIRIDGKDYLIGGAGARARYGSNRSDVLPTVSNINESGTLLDWFRRNSERESDILGQTEKVRGLVQSWLGPKFAEGYSEGFINDWAHKLRNSPQSEDALIDILRNQRMAVFPEYENPNLRYEDIAGPWRTVWSEQWGQAPDETDSLFMRVLRMNDMQGAETLLRQEGLKRGNRTVTSRFVEELGQAFGGTAVQGGMI